MRNLSEIDYSKPIRDFFPETDSVFICLFPFYNIVFAEHYNWEGNLKLTYPLLETVSWKEVAKITGFNTINRVASGLLDVKEPFKTELPEALEHYKIVPPTHFDDKIPETILIPVLTYLKRLNHKSLEMKPFDRFHFSATGMVDLTGSNVFDIYYQLRDSKFLITENQISMLLPNYDSPYILIFGNEQECLKLIEAANLETSKADKNTRFDWWNY